MCTDDDECSQGTDLCAQNCQDTQGSYTCSCWLGYALAADRHSCNGINIGVITISDLQIVDTDC